jgi:plastocyanin
MINWRMGLTATRKLLLLAIAGALIAAVLVAPTQLSAAPPADQAATKRVSVRDDRFSPKRMTVATRDRVRFTWRGDNPHDVKFRSVPRGASKRGAGIKRSGSFTRSFTKRGTYRYVCTIHVAAGMRGTVVAK